VSTESPLTDGEFAAICRLASIDEHTGLANWCDAKFTDPARFEEHMRGAHNRKKPQPPAMPKPWRPARRRRLYEPGEYDVGAWVPFAERRCGAVVVRYGQVWSFGPPGEGNSRWVIPDDGGDPVVVRISRQPVLASRTPLHVVSGYEMHRMNVRRAENLRRFGQLFAVVTEARKEPTWSGGLKIAEILCWHVDPSCPDAAGKPEPAAPYTPHDIAEVISSLLSGKINASTSRYCRRCFWLDESERDTAGSDQADE
jgi:hypothetical protein